MSDLGDTVRVNFGQRFPIFPLQEVVLLPHAVTSLYIFEDRYRQMTREVLDGAGQIAMAVFEGGSWPADYQGAPPVRPAVCIGEIIQHDRNHDGTYNIALRGVCRATIVQEEPMQDGRLYRQVQLAPAEAADQPDDLRTAAIRDRLLETIEQGRLSGVESVRAMIKQIEDRKSEIPANLAIDAVALGLISVLNTPELRYRLLEEGDVAQRGSMIRKEVEHYESSLSSADLQYDPDAPRGVSWN